MIELRFCSVDWTPGGCVSHFRDGRSYGAHPHDLPHYHAIAHRLGYEGDILRYCREHEVAHHVIGEAFDQPSAVLWALAHGAEPSAFDAAAEESLAMNLQAFARTNQVPFVAGVDWSRSRSRFLAVLEKADA